MPSELEQLRDRVAELEDALGMHDAERFPLELSPRCRCFLGMLLRRPIVPMESIAAALWGGKPDVDRPEDEPNNVRNLAWHLRKGLKALGVKVKVSYNGAHASGGYYMTHADKAVIQKFIAVERAQLGHGEPVICSSPVRGIGLIRDTSREGRTLGQSAAT